jgi:YesN/AraC family two-component response regulator
MKYRTTAAFISITIMGVIMAILAYRHFKNKRLFEELMNRKPETSQSLVSDINRKESELDINPEVIASILKNLEKFERNKKYLEKDMTLAKMASLLSTNMKYASKIIARYRDKGTIDYISDLKIDHIIELLKNENKYRNYTNKALGEESGFGSTQNFTRAFNNRTGLSPTYFINKLKSQQHS